MHELNGEARYPTRFSRILEGRDRSPITRWRTLWEMLAEHYFWQAEYFERQGKTVAWRHPAHRDYGLCADLALLRHHGVISKRLYFRAREAVWAFDHPDTDCYLWSIDDSQEGRAWGALFLAHEPQWPEMLDFR